MGMGQDTQVILSDQWFTLKLTTHQLLLHFIIKQYYPPTPSALWGQIQTIAKLTNQEIAPDFFSKKKKKKIAGCLQAPAHPQAEHNASPLRPCLLLLHNSSAASASSQLCVWDVSHFFLKSSMCALGAKKVLFCAEQSAQDIVVLKTEMTKPRVIQKEL